MLTVCNSVLFSSVVFSLNWRPMSGMCHRKTAAVIAQASIVVSFVAMAAVRIHYGFNKFCDSKEGFEYCTETYKNLESAFAMSAVVVPWVINNFSWAWLSCSENILNEIDVDRVASILDESDHSEHYSEHCKKRMVVDIKNLVPETRGTILGYIGKLEEENKKYKTDIKTLEEDNKKYETDIETLEKDNKKYKTDIKTLEEENIDLKKYIAEFRAEIESLKKEQTKAKYEVRDDRRDFRQGPRI